MKIKFAFAAALLVVAFATFSEPSASAAVPQDASPSPSPESRILQARNRLQEGWDDWNAETMREARDQILGLLLQAGPKNADLLYYAGLSEYRLTVHAFSTGETNEAGAALGRAKKYFEDLMELRPGWSEPYALQATLLGFDIALNPNLGMELGMKTMSLFSRAERQEPENPRVRYLKAASLLYWPPEFGGGADNALPLLQSAVELFDKDKSADPIKPSWGKEEALTMLAGIFKQKGEKDRALACLTEALAANPRYGLARRMLQELQ